MSYPEEWRSFFVKHMLPFEGGFQPSNSSIFGILKENWADLITKIPLDELAKVNPPSLRQQIVDIRNAPASQRLSNTVDWIHDVARHTHAWGNKTQPLSGTPYRSEEYASPTGNKSYLAGVHELAFGIFYRDYIQGVGITGLPVQHRIQETVADISVRYGTAHSYALLVKSMQDSGIISSRQMNEWGWVKSAELPDRATYQEGGAGYNYTLTSTRREIADTLKGVSAEQQQALFDYYGKWRRTYDAHKDNQAERAGDDKRTMALHGSPSAALARLTLAEDKGIAAWGDEPVKPKPAAKTAAALPIGRALQSNEVYIQNAKDDSWFGDHSGVLQLAIDIPGHGVMHYGLKETKGYIRDEGSNKFERGTLQVLDPTKIFKKPAGVHVVQPGQRALGVTNPFADIAMLVWKDATGNVQPLVLTPEMHRGALAVSMRYEWMGMAYADNFDTIEKDGQKRLNPEGSAILSFGKGREAFTKTMSLIQHPAGEPRTASNVESTSVADPVSAAPKSKTTTAQR